MGIITELFIFSPAGHFIFPHDLFYLPKITPFGSALSPSTPLSLPQQIIPMQYVGTNGGDEWITQTTGRRNRRRG